MSGVRSINADATQVPFLLPLYLRGRGGRGHRGIVKTGPILQSLVSVIGITEVVREMDFAKDTREGSILICFHNSGINETVGNTPKDQLNSNLLDNTKHYFLTLKSTSY